jgi:hypothetical protein
MAKRYRKCSGCGQDVPERAFDLHTCGPLACPECVAGVVLFVRAVEAWCAPCGTRLRRP